MNDETSDDKKQPEILRSYHVGVSYERAHFLMIDYYSC